MNIAKINLGILKGQYYRFWEMQQGNFAVDEEAEDHGLKPETPAMDIDDEDVIVYT